MNAKRSSPALWLCLLTATLGCSGESSDSGQAGGTAGSAATSGTGGGQGGTASGGAAGGLTGGAGGGTNVLFRDDFDAVNPAWHFDTGDPQATYEVIEGGLRVTGGSLQAFGWLTPEPSWGDDVEVEVSFRIETGRVGGAVLRADPTVWDAVNCNLRDDYEQLRVAQHTARTYLTLGATAAPVEPGVDYVVRARVGGNTLSCFEAGGAAVTESPISLTSGVLGFFVYQGTVRFDSYEVTKPSG